MGSYNFVGSYCEIDGGRIKLDKFGQAVTLEDDVAGIVVNGGGAILPSKDFEKIGFTEQELSLYPYPGQQDAAPEAFKRKRQAAAAAFCKLKQDGFQPTQKEAVNVVQPKS